MKFTTTEFLPDVDRIDTDPPGPYWIMVDRTTANWRTTLRGPKEGRSHRVQIAEFNPHACYGSSIELAILDRLNSTPLDANPEFDMAVP